VQPALGDPALAGGWTGCSPEGPSKPCHAGILGFSITMLAIQLAVVQTCWCQQLLLQDAEHH